MADQTGARVNLLHLRAEVETEIELTESVADPNNIEDPDTEAYDIRLRSLRDAVEVAALYEHGSDQPAWLSPEKRDR
ncbi:hypothetical protein FOE78_19855 [Microlunatus elymi]|uniref:Uncharacterized protein n=1 Tax=Microlunatus elymi TaxID=2596828 RepID=A0A516Q359_9ACTN|nr:hypothetical protein [Microlunatus elymi]QDP97859.1 hypothetical protein FOE78_19855 [Microlunatus elymi]